MEKDSSWSWSGPDAAIKKLYEIDLDDFSIAEGTTVEKTLVRDLMDDLWAATNGNVIEKVEGVAVTSSGQHRQ